jgi:hypothetical protein
MFVGGRRVLVCLLAMFVSRFGVLFCLFMLGKIMMMGGLMMMVGGGVVMSGCLMMVLAGRMLWRLCHGVLLPTSPRRWMPVVAKIKKALSRRNYDGPIPPPIMFNPKAQSPSFTLNC